MKESHMIKHKKEKVMPPMEKFDDDESFDFFEDENNISVAM